MISGLTKNSVDTRLFIGIIGEPGTGKTTAAHTFPKPLVLEGDKKSPIGCDQVNFTDQVWVYSFLTGKTNVEPSKLPKNINVRDAIIKWTREQCPQLPSDITLILDSWSAFEAAFNIQGDKFSTYGDIVPYLDKEREFDNYKFYRHKLVWCEELIANLKTAPCNVIINMHEMVEFGSQKLKPYMQGQFGAKMPSKLPCFIRSIVMHYDRLAQKYPAEASYYKEFNADKVLNDKTACYLWQIKASDRFNAILPVNFQCNLQFIPAHYNAFKSFMPTISQSVSEDKTTTTTTTK